MNVRNLNYDNKYDVYIKTDCGEKTSYWVGPLLIYMSYDMNHTGINSITTCSKIIYDSGGPNGNYENNANSILTIYPETSGNFVSIKGTAVLEDCCDHLYIYDGDGTSGKQLYNSNDIYNSGTSPHSYSYTIPLIVSTSGPLTIKFTADGSTVFSGFRLEVSCVNNTETKYNLIKSNKCRLISCDNDWRSIQNKIVQDTGECVTDCNKTSFKYQYRGKCYNTCPDNTTDINYICYSNNVIEKCEKYSIYSDYEDLCIKCKDNYYPMLNDKSNKNGFINCYKNNSLEKYYLDNDDLIFKSCYKSCKTCDKNGTIEKHNCITCDTNYEFNISYE